MVRVHGESIALVVSAVALTGVILDMREKASVRRRDVSGQLAHTRDGGVTQQK